MIIGAGCLLLGATTLLAKPTLKLTVLAECPQAQSPLASGDGAAYVVWTGAHHETGWPSPKNEFTRAELDAELQRAMAANGFHPAGTADAPRLAMVYHWGAHNLPSPEDRTNDSFLLRKNVLERAALVGGKGFALELKRAMLDGIAMMETNAQGFRGFGGQASVGAARSAAVNDPITRFRSTSDKYEFLFDQSASDCFFVVISAYAYDAAANQRGDLVWRTNATVRAERIEQRRAIPLLFQVAAPFFGRHLAEAETLTLPVE